MSSELKRESEFSGGRLSPERTEELARRKRNQDPEVVVVTGASAGVGRAVVRRFAQEGAHVGLIARGMDGLEGARKDMEALGGKALICQADVADATKDGER